MTKCRFLIPLMLLPGLSCEKAKREFPPEPEITHVSTSPHEIRVFDTAGLIRIRFHFTDGDGDLGVDPNSGTMGIFLKDSRDTAARDYTHEYPFPYIEPVLRPEGGLEGTATINLGRQYFPITDSTHIALGGDTLVWSIYIRDTSGNKSNIIQSDTIYIKYE